MAMERAKKVTLVESAPPAPRTKKAEKAENTVLAGQKKALDLSPEQLVVDNSYSRGTYEESLKSVKSAAYVVNTGQRKAWPKDKYYGIYRVHPDDPTATQLLIGLRTHIKPEWEDIVNRAGSRVKPATEDAPAADDPFDAPQDVEDNSDAA